MNHFQNIIKVAATFLLGLIIAFSSCKKVYDAPPVQTDPNLVANTSIKSLKALHTNAGAFDVITTDIIISGTVVADDKSGNLYKQIYIQDSTGGIQLALESASIYTQFPKGRKIFVKCKGLCVSDYFNTMQLGMKATVAGIPSFQGIPANLINSYVIGGTLNNPVIPQVVTLSQLGTTMQDKYIGSLVQLDGMEFQPIDTSKTYGDTSAYKNANDVNARACSNLTALIDVRSSGYASFAGVKASKGNGSLIGIYVPYKTTKQLVIRDTSDVKFYGSRCGTSGGGGGGTTITMAQLRALHTTAADVTVPPGTVVYGKVISFSGNESAGNFRIQDGSGAGVILYTTIGSPTYALGDVLRIDAGSGGVLTLFNGDLELKSVPLSGVTVTTTNPITITPVVSTVAQIIANSATISSTMVKINNVTSIVAGTTGTTGTNYTIKDASSTTGLVIFVRTASGIVVNTAGTSVTGYVSVFNGTAQIGIRMASDIQ